MKIYAVLWEDSRSETTVTLFPDLTNAQSWAKMQALSICPLKENLEEICFR